MTEKKDPENLETIARSNGEEAGRFIKEAITRHRAAPRKLRTNFPLQTIDVGGTVSAIDILTKGKKNPK